MLTLAIARLHLDEASPLESLPYLRLDGPQLSKPLGDNERGSRPRTKDCHDFATPLQHQEKEGARCFPIFVDWGAGRHPLPLRNRVT